MDVEAAREDLAQHFVDLRSSFLEAVAGLTDAQMVEPSIDGWSVKDHLAHLAYWHELRAVEITRITAGYQRAWEREVDYEPLNEILQKARAHLSLDQARWEYEVSVERVIEAIRGANEKAFDYSRYGEVGLRTTHDMAHTDFIRNWREKLGI